MGEYRRTRVKLRIPKSIRLATELKTDYCGRKVVYKTKKDALTKKNQRFAEDHVELRIYHCSFCNGFHLTHKLYEREEEES